MGEGWRYAAFGRSGAFGARCTSAPHAMLSSRPLRVTRVCSLARSQRCCGLRPQRPLAARPSAALAPSAPVGTCIGMQLSRAGQSNLARLLARKPWTPRAFRAKGIKSTGTPHFAPAERKIPTNIAGILHRSTQGFRLQMPRRPEERLRTRHILLPILIGEPAKKIAREEIWFQLFVSRQNATSYLRRHVNARRRSQKRSQQKPTSRRQQRIKLRMLCTQSRRQPRIKLRMLCNLCTQSRRQQRIKLRMLCTHRTVVDERPPVRFDKQEKKTASFALADNPGLSFNPSMATVVEYQKRGLHHAHMAYRPEL
jgi:hypothetical protein